MDKYKANDIFSQTDFIKIFLAISTMYDISNIDVESFGFDMAKYYKDEKFNKLFFKFEMFKKNNKDYVYTDIAIGYAQLLGLLVDTKDSKNIKKIDIRNVDEYILQYPYCVNDVKELVSLYNKDVAIKNNFDINSKEKILK